MTLSHACDGSGPAVVLLHSTVCDRRMWDPQVPALTAAGFRAIRVDLPGYGDSPVPDAPLDWAAEVLATAGADRFTLVGSSGGGQVALEIAARWPQRVDALVLLCTAAPGLVPGPRLRGLWEREDELLRADDVEAATELNVELWLGPRAGDDVREQVRVMQRHAFEVQLAADEPDEVETPYDVGAITAPTLLVSGAHDLPEFGVLAADLAGRIAGAEHVELGWAGHLPGMEDPGAVNELLLSRLRAWAVGPPGSGS